jgi:hypothetical protein
VTRLFTVTFDLYNTLQRLVLFLETSSSRLTFFRRHARQACHTRPPAGSAVSGAFGPAPSSLPGANMETSGMLSFGEKLMCIYLGVLVLNLYTYLGVEYVLGTDEMQMRSSKLLTSGKRKSW